MTCLHILCRLILISPGLPFTTETRINLTNQRILRVQSMYAMVIGSLPNQQQSGFLLKFNHSFEKHPVQHEPGLLQKRTAKFEAHAEDRLYLFHHPDLFPSCDGNDGRTRRTRKTCGSNKSTFSVQWLHLKD